MTPTFSGQRELTWSQIYKETNKHLKVGDVVSAIPWPDVIQDMEKESLEPEFEPYFKEFSIQHSVRKRIVAMPGDTAYYQQRKGNCLAEPKGKVVVRYTFSLIVRVHRLLTLRLH